jgi:hypothetical protein
MFKPHQVPSSYHPHTFDTLRFRVPTATGLLKVGSHCEPYKVLVSFLTRKTQRLITRLCHTTITDQVSAIV